MSSRIDRFGRLRAGSDPPSSTNRTDFSTDAVAKGLLTTPRRGVDDAVIVRSERIYNKPLAVSAAERAVETQQAAVEAILDVRAEQVRILEEAEELAVSSRIDRLSTQRAAQESEVTRIRNAASVNGANLFSEGTVDISVTDISRNINEVALLPTSTGVAAVISGRVQTAAGATTMKNTTERAISSLSAFAAGISGIDSKVGSIITKANPNVVAEQAAKAAQSVESFDPTALASAIAGQISDPFISDRLRQEIIDASAAKLDPVRVKNLLDDEEDSDTSS